MLLSRCCLLPLYVMHGDEGTSYYLCSGCDYSTDAIDSSQLPKDSIDDTRHDVKA